MLFQWTCRTDQHGTLRHKFTRRTLFTRYCAAPAPPAWGLASASGVRLSSRQCEAATSKWLANAGREQRASSGRVVPVSSVPFTATPCHKKSTSRRGSSVPARHVREALQTPPPRLQASTLADRASREGPSTGDMGEAPDRWPPPPPGWRSAPINRNGPSRRLDTLRWLHVTGYCVLPGTTCDLAQVTSHNGTSVQV